MLGVGFILFSSLWAAAGNLCMRKNLDFNGTSSGYLVAYYLFSFVASQVCMPIDLNALTTFNLPMFVTGAVVGALNVGLMLLIGKALSLGPAGLTFAFVSTAAITPSILMPLIFGHAFGFQLTASLVLGLSCVLMGLFWAAFQQKEQKAGSLSWLGYSCSLLIIQGIILSIVQWQNLLIDPNLPSHSLLFIKAQPEDVVWFMPGMFLMAFVLQSLNYILNEKRMLRKAEIGFGSLGGLANGASMLFMIYATQAATSGEKGILFPCFAIATIILCNVWGQLLYHENVNWKANALCSLGIILGAIS